MAWLSQATCAVLGRLVRGGSSVLRARSRSVGTPPGLAFVVRRVLVVPTGQDTCFSKNIPEVTMERGAKRCCLVFILRLAQSHSMTRGTVHKLSDGSSMSTGFVTQDYLE